MCPITVLGAIFVELGDPLSIIVECVDTSLWLDEGAGLLCVDGAVLQADLQWMQVQSLVHLWLLGF